MLFQIVQESLVSGSYKFVAVLYYFIFEVEAFGVDCVTKVLRYFIELQAAHEIDPLPLLRLLKILLVLFQQLIEML